MMRHRTSSLVCCVAGVAVFILAATARFPERGIYVLRATANDGALSTTADVTVAVDQGTAR
mgnify:CR=1 FL=1